MRASPKQALQWTPQGHRGRGRSRNTWKRDLEKEMRTAVSRIGGYIQVQLEEDGGGSTRHSWMETSGLWPTFHREPQGISRVSHNFYTVRCQACN